MKETISGWGNYPVIDAEVSSFCGDRELAQQVSAQSGIIARGLARSYGDSCLSEHVISTHRFNRFISFDDSTATVKCESGVSLADILDVFVPRGWFLPVTPGTKFVTIGGAIASDVHGKNHHAAGSFCDYVEQMDIMTADGQVVSCSKGDDLYRATCGGMGLTGIILHATIRLAPIESVYIAQETVKASGLKHIMELFESSSGWTYSVAWIDCLSTGRKLGRSILMRGEHAKADALSPKVIKRGALVLPPKIKLSVPFNFPSIALNKLSVKAFNALYYGKAPAGSSKTTIPYDGFFYPLDAIHDWNRIYGKRGFVQYQFVLPLEASAKGMREILSRIAHSGMGSFLAVLKLFGKQEGLMNFPMEGYTLALDFPMKRGLLEFLDEMDRMVLDFGGRIYLTKDARMTAETLRASYPNLEEFLTLRERFDPQRRFASLQSRRLEL